MNKICLLLLPGLLWLVPIAGQTQTTDIVILTKAEIHRLRILMKENSTAKSHGDSIAGMAETYLKDLARPVAKIHYEGLLQTNPDRIATQESLLDVDKVVIFIYAHYSKRKLQYGRKAKEMVMAWARNYIPEGNTINENKLVPLFWAYHVFRDRFSNGEKKMVEKWMMEIANKQLGRLRTPNNNWEAKRLKIIATVGCIIGDKALMDYSIEGFKKYINTAYYPDGTSNDLKERDALHYHISGLIPTIGVFVNCTPFDPAFDLFRYISPTGSSIKKSVEHTIPYAKGEEEREEWTNSKVALDKQRAAAGLAQYQPGLLFDPAKAKPMFEWASYYHPDWYVFLGEGTVKENYTSTWIGMLNSPLIRR
jgi:hypothetical protein